MRHFQRIFFRRIRFKSIESNDFPPTLLIYRQAILFFYETKRKEKQKELNFTANRLNMEGLFLYSFFICVSIYVFITIKLKSVSLSAGKSCDLDYSCYAEITADCTNRDK